ncbi:MAG: GNAT family N-acetyltransferase, partial [Dermatophilaceae bacterium]
MAKTLDESEVSILGAGVNFDNIARTKPVPDHPVRPGVYSTSPGARRDQRFEGVGTILGFATVTVGDVGEPELDDLFVDPQWQRRGVAWRLIQHAVQTVRESGRQRLWVTANPHASVFYAAVGFLGSERVATQLGPGLRLHLDCHLTLIFQPGDRGGCVVTR